MKTLVFLVIFMPFLVSGQGLLLEEAGRGYANLLFSTPEEFSNENFGAAEQNLREGQVKLPSRVSHRSLIPDSGDQKDTLSCVSWTCSYGLLSFLAPSLVDVLGGDRIPPRDPYYMHHWLVKENMTQEEQNTGVYYDRVAKFSSAFNSLRTRGGVEFGRHPNFSIDPKVDVIDEGNVFKVNINPKRIAPDNIVFDIRKALSEGKPIPAGFMIDKSFKECRNFQERTLKPRAEDHQNQDGGPYPAGKVVKVWHSRGEPQEWKEQHAMLIVGYDDEVNAFEVMNSYGPDWCVDGNVWVDYGFFSHQGNDHEDASDNPCCISAFNYVIEKEIDFHSDTGWARLRDVNGNFNFSEITDPPLLSMNQIIVVKPGAGRLAVRKAVVPQKGKNNRAILTAYGFLFYLRSGDQFKVMGLQKVQHPQTGKHEYWVKGKVIRSATANAGSS